MAINWQQIITTVGGGGIALAAVAWLIKQVVTSLLARETEEFKIRLKADADRETEALKAQLKASADVEIERTRAFLVRASRVHQRQIVVLQNLYRHLSEALGYFQGQTSSVRFKGVPGEEECARLVMKALRAAHEELLKGSLLIPPDLAQQCNAFFDEVAKGQGMFSLSQAPMMTMNPTLRAELTQGAGKVGFTKLPEILRAIEAAARDVIHGKPPEDK